MRTESRGVKFLAVLMVAALGLLPVTNLYSQAAAQEPVTQGEFAIYLVRALGIEGNLPLGADVTLYIRLLEKSGIIPPGGYDPDKPLNQKDMAFLMVRVTGLESKVINRMTGKSLVKKEKAIIKKITGDVKFRRGLKSSYAKAEVGDELFTDDSIKTGSKSSAELQIGKFSAAQIGEKTEVLIEELAEKGASKTQKVRLFLQKGNICVNVKKGKKVNFETRTTTTVAGVMGTILSQTSTPAQDQTVCGEGVVSTYLIDPTGKPLGAPKDLNPGDALTADPNGKKDPVYSTVDVTNLVNDGRLLDPNIPSGTEGAGTPGEGDASGDLSGFEARKQLSDGSDAAFNAAVETLSEEGVVIDAAGAAAATDTVITHTQLTQFINDLLLFGTFTDFNVDTTPIEP